MKAWHRVACPILIVGTIDQFSGLAAFYLSVTVVLLRKADMSRSVFVGNLPYSAREEDVANFFWQVGPVTNVRIVLDRDTGRPRGFGFCEFETEEAAEQAVGSMNHAEFMGRQLRVDRAISR